MISTTLPITSPDSSRRWASDAAASGKVLYTIGAATCAVPGLPAALGELWERLGRLPWRRLLEPALALARSGVPMPEMHARSLEMLGGLYSLGRGADLYLREGRTLEPTSVSFLPGS